MPQEPKNFEYWRLTLNNKVPVFVSSQFPELPGDSEKTVNEYRITLPNSCANFAVKILTKGVGEGMSLRLSN